MSLVGLSVLLGLGFLFSNARKSINFVTIVWGVSLQLLFAAIILLEEKYSFAGMFALVSLLSVYFASGYLGERVSKWVLWPATAGLLFAIVWPLHKLAETSDFVGYLVNAAALVWFGSLLTTWGRERVTAFLARAETDHPPEEKDDREPIFRASSVTGPAFLALLVFGFAELWGNRIEGQEGFRFISEKVAAFLALTNSGSEFLFGNLAKPEFFFSNPDWPAFPGFGFQFAFAVLPTIIFFSAFMAVLYHLGLIQVIVAAMARFMRWTLGTSGSETVSCTANVFVGQTEAPFMVKPFLDKMTPSELHAIMVGGFSTIAGGVLAGYVQMGVNPGHLIAASVMSAPAALVIAKLLFPETQKSETAGDVAIPKVKVADNVVGAAASGVTDGLKLAANVGAMLIAFLALIKFADVVLLWADGIIDGQILGFAFDEARNEFAGIFPGSMETLFGTVFRPLAIVMGVPTEDASAVGNLMGIKIAANEFVAYGKLTELIGTEAISPRAQIIATYALCGFANFASIGIQIGGIGAIAPNRRAALAKVAVRAMFGGAIASWMTATVAGLFIGMAG